MDLPKNAPLNPEPKKNWFLRHEVLYSIIGILLLIVIIGGVIWWRAIINTPAINSLPVNKEKNITPQTFLPIPESWNKYNNDVIGVSFSAPSEWGKISTFPIENITDLSSLGQETNMANSYYNSININFKQNKAPKISIYSQEFGGQNYNPRGFIDNILTLKRSDNACNYKIDYESRDSLHEIYSECKNGVKIVVLENIQHFNPPTGTLYTYSLNYYGFKHLQNGSFDYLLAVYDAAKTNQQAARLTADEFINKSGITKGAYPNFPEFEIFVQSIKTYTPPKPQILEFSVPPGEDPNITLIRKYYYLLAKGELNNAYQLLYKPTLSMEKFTEDNQGIYKIQPRDFNPLASGKYEYWIDHQQRNRNPVQERSVVEIINGMIKQDLFETLTSNKATFRSSTAYGSSRGDQSLVILTQGHNEVVVDSAPNDFDKTLETLIFVNTSFSPKGNYLSYLAGGWEWSILRVYDITNKKQVIENAGGHGEFNPDETIYFYCVRNDFGGDFDAKIYEVPGFTVKTDLLKQFPESNDYLDVDCTADQQNHTLKFEFVGKYDSNQNYDKKAKKVYNFNLNTGELITTR